MNPPAATWLTAAAAKGETVSETVGETVRSETEETGRTGGVKQPATVDDPAHTTPDSYRHISGYGLAKFYRSLAKRHARIRYPYIYIYIYIHLPDGIHRIHIVCLAKMCISKSQNRMLTCPSSHICIHRRETKKYRCPFSFSVMPYSPNTFPDTAGRLDQ